VHGNLHSLVARSRPPLRTARPGRSYFIEPRSQPRFSRFLTNEWQDALHNNLTDGNSILSRAVTTAKEFNMQWFLTMTARKILVLSVLLLLTQAVRSADKLEVTYNGGDLEKREDQKRLVTTKQ
jgi:hypothetical protein